VLGLVTVLGLGLGHSELGFWLGLAFLKDLRTIVNIKN